LQDAGVTRREADVLEALGDHLPNSEIATRLSISVRTVESHLSALLTKLEASDRHTLGHIARSVVVGPASSARLPLSLLELAKRGVFVGRQDELGLLRDRWADATSGRRRVVLVLGQLIKRVVRRAHRSRLLVLGTVRGTRLGGRLLDFADDLRRASTVPTSCHCTVLMRSTFWQ
jgi:DNA-binding CsgD family transcriptional regulator